MKRFIIFFLFSFLFFVIIRSFIITTYVVDGDSMAPTYNDGDTLVIDVISDTVKPPVNGDVIFFKLNEQTTFVKRIVATPGDYLSVKDSKLYVNGKKLNDIKSDYDELLKVDGVNDAVVIEKCYIVIGDNIQNSTDSRTFGCVNEEFVIGRVIWPQ